MRKAVFTIIATLTLARAIPLAAATTIEKILPFTPDVNAVRIVVTAHGSDELNATIMPWHAANIVWQGSLGKAGKDGQVEKILRNLPVKPWSPAEPNLYELRMTGGGSSQTIRFGFRKFESKNGHFYLNNKPIFMRGLAINPPGRGVPDAVGKSKQFAHDYVAYLRKQNLNLIRMNEDSQEWFDACDELGMMVYQGFYSSPPTGLSKEELKAHKEAEVSLGTQAEGEGKKLPKDVDRSFQAYKSNFETYVRHPSIVIYVLSNEMPYHGQAGAKVHDFLSKMYDRLAAWDHTRQYIGNAGYGQGREADINDIHRYWGWYYNSVYTFENLRDPKAFGDPEKNQPMTFSECVGNFTGPSGAYNCIERKQLAAAQQWAGHVADQVTEAQSYQAFTNKNVIEEFRRLRAINPHISGLMPFTITFHNWDGIKSFDQMKPTAAVEQMGVSYQPVLLSFENWQPQVYAGSTTTVRAHVINDSDDGSDLTGATLAWSLQCDERTPVLPGKIELPKIAYYSNWQTPIELNLPPTLPTGEYKLSGVITKDGHEVAHNRTMIFIAGPTWRDAPARPSRRLVAADEKSAVALNKLGFGMDLDQQASSLDPAHDCLVIGENVWPQIAQAKARIAKFVHDGGRVLCLGHSHTKFDSSWLPVDLKVGEHSVNDSEYPPKERPTHDDMQINIERPEHPIFAGVDRNRLKLWSDPTNWDETKKGFPHVYPVEYAMTPAKQEDLAKTAILADCDQGLSAIALGEIFDGKGSALLCGFEIIDRVGIDPVADRLLINMATYMANDENHARYPLIEKPIHWGDYPTEKGVVNSPLYGLFTNTIWLQPPTDPSAPQLEKSKGAWNTRAGDEFTPHGIRPRGPFTYSFNDSPKDVDKKATKGTGIFWATIPPGRKTVVTKVQNPTNANAKLEVKVNDKGNATSIPPGAIVTIQTPIADNVTDVSVRYSGEKELVILETDFR